METIANTILYIYLFFLLFHIVYLEDAKTVYLKSSLYKKNKCVTVCDGCSIDLTVVIVSQYTHKSLCCTPKMNTRLHVNYISMF